MSGNKKMPTKRTLAAAVLGVALVGIAPSGCGGAASMGGHDPGNATVVAASHR
jgi:hypothetical protein